MSSNELVQHPTFIKLKHKYHFEYSVQEERLGTAHALLCALKHDARECTDVLVLCGDAPLITAEILQNLIAAHKKSAAYASIVCFNSQNPYGYGRVFVNDDRLEAIVEQKDLQPNQEQNATCNSGIILLRNEQLQQALQAIDPNPVTKEYYLTDIISQYCKNGKHCSYIMAPEWEVHGVNTPQHLNMAEQIMQQRIADKLQSAGVRVMQPVTSFFAADIEAQPGVTIYPNVFIGSGVKLQAGAVIHSFSWLMGCTIGVDNAIGPFARIRPGTVTQKAVKVGNFVETKQATIGDGTKISHLTYVGDATVGAKVNIGAGTVFCNYDGVKKHHTTVADNVFIGSNASLVAPLSIGKGSLIGAGSVVTNSCDEDALVIGRSRQKTLPLGAKALRK